MKYKYYLFMLLVMLIPVVMMAQDAVEIDGIYYNLIPKVKVATVASNPNKYSGDIVIPSTVTYNDVVYAVTDIKNAFSYCSSLTSITIPESVTSIGDYAFDNCTGLTSIDIPNSVTSIGNYAFSGCRLPSVTISSSVITIGWQSFLCCDNLTSIHISNGVKSINIPEGQSFRGCPLSSLTVDTENSSYDSRNNCNAIIETATNTLVLGCKNTIIPNSVTSIGNGAFSYCSSLTSITIPESVTSIGDNAFDSCTGLTSIGIPNSVTSIGENVFIGCFDLTSVSVEWDAPLSVPSNIFLGLPLEQATLYVPYGTKEAYEAADVWKEFGNIVEIGNLQEQTLSLTELPAMTYGDAAYTLPETTIDGLTITWSSSDTNVATVGGNTLTIVGAGTATITASQEGNESYMPFTQEFALTVNKASLTIIANDCERETGENNPSFTLTYEGFVNGDDATCLTTAPTVTCTATAESAPGTYTIRVSGAESPNYDISYVNGTLTVNQAYSTTCALTVAPVTIHTGTTTTLSISLDNEESLVAFEFDLQLPEGVSIATDGDGYFDAVLNSARSNRHVLEVSTPGDGQYHFLCYSSGNNAFKGNSGELLHVTLICDEEQEPGAYQGNLHTIKFADKEENRIYLTAISFDINVTDVLPGDVNDDGDIDVFDVVAMVNLIMGTISTEFVFAAADLVEDGLIDVFDLVKLVNIIMDQGASNVGSFDQLSGNLSLRSCHDGSIALDIAGNDRYVASQFVVTLAEGQRLAAVTTDGRHTVTYERIADDKYAVVCYSNANNTFASNEGILNLYVTGRGNVGIENVLFVNTSDERVAFQSIQSSFTDGIGSLVLDPSNPADIYSISGALVRKAATSTQGIQSGVYIVNGKKAVVK